MQKLKLDRLLKNKDEIIYNNKNLKLGNIIGKSNLCS